MLVLRSLSAFGILGFEAAEGALIDFGQLPPQKAGLVSPAGTGPLLALALGRGALNSTRYSKLAGKDILEGVGGPMLQAPAISVRASPRASYGV